MLGKSASSSGSAACITYRAPARWSLSIAFGLAAAALLIGAVRAVPERPVDAGVMAALVVLIAWTTWFEAWLIETRPEGLYVRYTFGSAELIPYSDISRLVVRVDRLQIHTTSKYMAHTSIELGFRKRGRPDRADPLIAAIAQAARLTKVSASSLGWPTYDRE